MILTMPLNRFFQRQTHFIAYEHNVFFHFGLVRDFFKKHGEQPLYKILRRADSVTAFYSTSHMLLKLTCVFDGEQHATDVRF